MKSRKRRSCSSGLFGAACFARARICAASMAALVAGVLAGAPWLFSLCARLVADALGSESVGPAGPVEAHADTTSRAAVSSTAWPQFAWIFPQGSISALFLLRVPAPAVPIQLCRLRNLSPSTCLRKRQRGREAELSVG